MDKFNNQFSTRKLREFDQSEFHPNKFWDFLDTQDFDDTHTSFKRKTAKEIWMMMTPEEKEAYAAYQWEGDTEEMHPKERRVLRARKLSDRVDRLKFMTSLMHGEEIQETSATGGTAAMTPSTVNTPTNQDWHMGKKKTDETIKKVGDKYAVYPEKGGKRLGTHDSKAKAKKQLAAIEISKQQKETKERGTGKGFIFKDLWEDESLKENYSRFRNETKTRPKSQQMHAAVKLAEKKIREANRILEYTSQLRTELFESGETKYAKHTEDVMERMVKSIAEAYKKLKEIKSPSKIEEGIGSWVKDKMEKFWKSLGGEPVKVSELEPGKVYRLEGYNEKNKPRAMANPDNPPMPQYLSNVVYDGPSGSDKHLFVIKEVYKDYEPLTGSAPKRGTDVILTSKEVEAFIKTAG
jgi:hypothetical protein